MQTQTAEKKKFSRSSAKLVEHTFNNFVFLTVGRLAVQLSLPTSTQVPLAFLYHNLFSEVTATTAYSPIAPTLAFGV